MHNTWHSLNVQYWDARNAVTQAVLEQRLDEDEAFRIKLSMRDILQAAATDEQQADALAAFNSVTAKYRGSANVEN